VVGESGLTAKPGDANELAEKIETILTDQTLADKFSRLALQEVKEKYNWDKHVSCLEQVYQQVC
jgi:glycosyltransferase involved in cell wall biosynthesis